MSACPSQSSPSSSSSESSSSPLSASLSSSSSASPASPVAASPRAGATEAAALPEPCAFEVYPGSRYGDAPEPPETCPEWAEPESEWCNAHLYLGED